MQLTHLYQTTDSKWKGRLDSVLEHALKVFFEDGAAVEVACESFGRCTSDMLFLKGIFVQMLASAAQVAPYIADTVLPVLQKSAEAAVKSCAGPDDACGFEWTSGEFDDKANAGTECNVLSSVAPLLAKAGDAPYTAKTGGISSGSTSGGSSGTTTTGDSTAGSNSTTTGNGGDDSGNSGNGGKTGKDGSGDKKGAATKMGGSVVVGLVMACAVVLLL